MRLKYVCTNCSKILLGEQGTMLRSALECDTFYRQLGAASIIIIPGPHHLGRTAKGAAAAGGREWPAGRCLLKMHCDVCLFLSWGADGAGSC